jgi:hypothetical protein
MSQKSHSFLRRFRSPFEVLMSNLALYLISVLVWGSTWFAIEFQLGTVEPEV